MRRCIKRIKPLAHDIKLQSFLEEFQITTGENYPADFTYVHGNGKSIIDYVLQNDVMVVKKVKIQTEYSENTSPHCPLAADIVQIPEITVIPKRPLLCPACQTLCPARRFELDKLLPLGGVYILSSTANAT